MMGALTTVLIIALPFIIIRIFDALLYGIGFVLGGFVSVFRFLTGSSKAQGGDRRPDGC